MKTDAKMIVIWGSENILNSSIQYLIANKAGWIVVSASNVEDFEALIHPVKNKLAEVVIIHQGDLDESCELPLQLLQGHSDLRVITISLESNVMDIYNKHSLLVNEASDLISVIENEFIPQ
jgi:hypothetical protein